MNIAKQTTNGITVSVVSKYEAGMAEKSEMPYNFSYTIEIFNESDNTIQLLKREWRIFDTFGTISYVKGEGVVGEQPIILPGQKFEYSSWCSLLSPIGNMSGVYEMINLDESDHTFLITIPKFILSADYLKN